MNSRDKILNRISESLRSVSAVRTPDGNSEGRISNALNSVRPKDADALWLQFKTELEKIAGEYFSYSSLEEACGLINKLFGDMNIKDLVVDNTALAEKAGSILSGLGINMINAGSLHSDERKYKIAGLNGAVVAPLYAVADIGSLVFVMDDSGTSYPHYLCDNTIALINKNMICADQFELFEKLDREKAKNMFFVTGPSRTADIEKVLVLGAHGPRRLIVITID